MKSILFRFYSVLRKMLSLFFYLLPLDKKTLLFTSLNGQYSDSPKALSAYFLSLGRRFKIVWAVKKTEMNRVPRNIKTIKFDSITHDFYKSRARVLVDNFYCGGRPIYDHHPKRIFFKKKQLCYSTWHGTPLKKIGRDIEYLKESILGFQCGDLTFLLGNAYSGEILKNLTFNKAKIELVGTPRNDVLFELKESGKTETRKKLGLPADKRIALFAPSFRSDVGEDKKRNVQRSGINQLNDMDIDRLLEQLSVKFGGEWILVCRFHHYVSQLVRWEELPKAVFNGNLSTDMSDYLSCSDVLITDVSSCMFDYCLTRKPCFLFFPDLDDYRDKERGFYLNILSLPFPCSTSFDQLINNVHFFDNCTYMRGIEALLETIGNTDDGRATERAAKVILRDLSR